MVERFIAFFDTATTMKIRRIAVRIRYRHLEILRADDNPTLFLLIDTRL